MPAPACYRFLLDVLSSPLALPHMPLKRNCLHLLVPLCLSPFLLACSTPAPKSAPLAVDAQIASAVAQISATRINQRIDSLVAFGTRHTMSETESMTRGIGAARRWIARELQTCSDAAGGRLQVTMDEHLAPAGERLPRATAIVNVVATLPGTEPAARARHLVVSGHYDSRASDVMDANSEAPGANDDASGVAAVMEMACVMAQAGQRLPATLVFMAVAGEEQGLLGAEFWAEDAKRKNLNVQAMITNDIIGSPVGDIGQRDPKQVRLFADGLSPLLRLALSPPRADKPAAEAAFNDALRLHIDAQARAGGSADFATNQLGRHLKEVGERYVPGFTVNLIQRPDRYLRGGDHLPFLARGFAAVRFTEPFENFLHQHQNVRTENGVRYGDLPEFVDTGYVADVARINLAGLATLAMAPAAPQEVFIETLELSNDTSLRWAMGQEQQLAGYRIVWRETSSATWQQHRDVGKVSRATLAGLSKDNLIFGVQALSAGGHASLASFPLPLRK
jgi:Peptidase family M28